MTDKDRIHQLTIELEELRAIVHDAVMVLAATDVLYTTDVAGRALMVSDHPAEAGA